MALTAAELLAVRSYVGSDPTDAELDALHDELGTHQAVAAHIVRARVTEMHDRPHRLEYDGDATEDWSANVASLERRAAQLEREARDSLDAGLPTGQLYRRRAR